MDEHGGDSPSDTKLSVHTERKGNWQTVPEPDREIYRVDKPITAQDKSLT